MTLASSSSGSPPAIPFVALGLRESSIKGEVLAAVERVLDGGQFILGAEVEAFEAAFAALCGTRFAVGMDNGTSALFQALRVLGIGPGDEVITAPNSFLASAAVIELVGARTVFVDVRDDLNMDPDLIEAALTPRTRALMPVHLTGRPAAMDRINAIASARGLAVIEDAAQAVGARFQGTPVGALGTIGCFSLHPLKNLAAAGDAGAVTTNDEAVAERLRRLRNHGLRDRDHTIEWSYNTRLDAIQAAILNVKLRHLEGWTARKRQLAARYCDGLRDVVRVPDERPGDVSVYQTFGIRADRRDDLQRWLAARGIDTRVHYPIPIHLQEAAKGLGYGKGDFPVTERLATEILSLPIYPELSDADHARIVDAIRAFYTGRA